MGVPHEIPLACLLLQDTYIVVRPDLGKVGRVAIPVLVNDRHVIAAAADFTYDYVAVATLQRRKQVAVAGYGQDQAVVSAMLPQTASAEQLASIGVPDIAGR